MARNKPNKFYEISAAFWETPCPHTIETPFDGSTTTTADNSFVATIEYATLLEEKTHSQAERILALEASVDGQTFLAKATKYAAIAVTAGVQQVPKVVEGSDEATHSFSHLPGGNIGSPIPQNTQWRRRSEKRQN